jgi:hypothetical protein
MSSDLTTYYIAQLIDLSQQMRCVTTISISLSICRVFQNEFYNGIPNVTVCGECYENVYT